jgi:hypothetical protein
MKKNYGKEMMIGAQRKLTEVFILTSLQRLIGLEPELLISDLSFYC